MASSTREGGDHEDEIRLWRDGEWWNAEDVETGVTTQGPSKEAALRNLDDAVAVHEGEEGEAPTAEELRAAGIDPAENSTGERVNRRTYSTEMDRRTFSGIGVAKVLVNVGGFEWRRTSGNHAQLYYEHPTNESDRRRVTIPLHDELRTGTLRVIADDA